MNETNINPLWLSILNIMVGLVFILLAGISIMDFGFSKEIVLVILAFLLSAVSVTRFINGLFDKLLTKTLKIMNLIIGTIGLSIALYIIFNPTLDIDSQIILIASGIFIQGLARIATGGTDQTFSIWLRGIFILIGGITILLALLVIIFGTIEESTLIVLLAYIFLLNGFSRLIHGISGLKFVSGTRIGRN